MNLLHALVDDHLMNNEQSAGLQSSESSEPSRKSTSPVYVSRRQVGDVRFGFILVDLKVFTIIVGLLYFLLPLGMPLCEDLLPWPMCVSCLHLLQRS